MSTKASAKKSYGGEKHSQIQKVHTKREKKKESCWKRRTTSEGCASTLRDKNEGKNESSEKG